MNQLLPSDNTGRGEPSSLAVSPRPETEIRAWESHGGWTLSGRALVVELGAMESFRNVQMGSPTVLG